MNIMDKQDSRDGLQGWKLSTESKTNGFQPFESLFEEM